jgi:hypothetical protein
MDEHLGCEEFPIHLQKLSAWLGGRAQHHGRSSKLLGGHTYLSSYIEKCAGSHGGVCWAHVGICLRILSTYGVHYLSCYIEKCVRCVEECARHMLAHAYLFLTHVGVRYLSNYMEEHDWHVLACAYLFLVHEGHTIGERFSYT